MAGWLIWSHGVSNAGSLISDQRMPIQDTYDLYGKFTEQGPGDGCLVFSHRHKQDNSRDISGDLLYFFVF